MYCPKCGNHLIINGDKGNRRAYCCNCGMAYIETHDPAAIHQASWKWFQTTGNNSIREYLKLEMEKENENFKQR